MHTMRNSGASLKKSVKKVLFVLELGDLGKSLRSRALLYIILGAVTKQG